MKNEELADAVRGKFEIMSGMRRDVHWVGTYIGILCFLHPVDTLPSGRAGERPLSDIFLFLAPREYGLSEFFPPRAQISQARAYQKSGVSVTLYLHISQLSHSQRHTNGNNSVVPQRQRGGLAVRVLRGCNGALTAMQRGCRCTLKAAPPCSREGLTARNRELFRTNSKVSNATKSAIQKRRKGLTGKKWHENVVVFAGDADATTCKEGLIGPVNERK